MSGIILYFVNLFNVLKKAGFLYIPLYLIFWNTLFWLTYMKRMCLYIDLLLDERKLLL